MRKIRLHVGAIVGVFLVGLFVDLGRAPAIAQDGPRIEKLGKDAEGFDTLTFRTGKPDPVVLLGGSVPDQVREPLATNSPTAGEGAFRVAPRGGTARFFQLWQPASTEGASEGFSRVAVGAAFTMAVRGDGALWSWGSNFRGSLGNGLEGSTNFPTPTGASGPWKALACGFNHTLALREDGTLWGWGENRYGEATGDTIGPVLTPLAIAPGVRWRYVAAGTWSSFAIRDDGSLWAWGKNESGQLGLGHSFDTNRPVQVGTAQDWVRVAAGQTHALGIRRDGSLWQWGTSNWGFTNGPAQILAGLGWKEVTTGFTHALALKTDGTLWSWGENTGGRLGLGTNRPAAKSLPNQVGTNTNWRAIGAASTHSAGLRSDGTLWAWGTHSLGALGLGESVLVTNRPTLVTGLGAVRELALGREHGVVVLEDGSLWGWGSNGTGEVGDGTRTPRFQPVPVASDAGWGR